MYSFWKRYLRPLTPAVLLVFTWYGSEPWNYAQAAQISSVPKPQAAPGAPGAASGEGLEIAVDDVDRALGELSRQISRGEAPASSLNRLAELHRQLDAAATRAREELRTQ